jgi:uncharacterized repeat protein (TIGR01451 family)
VAGIAAGQDPEGGLGTATGFSGVAPEANIIAIQVFTRFNNAADCFPAAAPCIGSYPSDQLSALNYINNTLRTSWNIASVNMSLGGGMFTSDCDGNNQGRKAAIDNLLSNNIATVISSGNDDYTDALSRPGCISTAVTVGGVDLPDDDVIWNMHDLVDLLAVGDWMRSSVPDDAYTFMWGTSMAAPQVTGAFAMIRAIDPSMSMADILNLLQTTGVLVTDGRPANPPGADTGHVKPRIQLDAAVADLTEADLRVLKDCKPDDPMLAGDEATCTISVENLGADPAMTVTAVDDYTSDGTFDFGIVTTSAGTCTTTWNPQVGAGTVTCELGSMQPGDVVTIEIPVTANMAQNISDQVTVSSITPDPDPANNVAEDEIEVIPVADLALTKTAAPEPVIAGTQLTYDLEVTNNGLSTAVNVVIEDVLPAEVTIDSVSSSGGTCSAGVPGDGTQPTTCTFGTLAAGGSATMQIVVTVEPHVLGILDNDARVYSDVYDPDNSNDQATTATTVEASADLAIAKDANYETANPSQPIVYTVRVVNRGPSDAQRVVMVDSLPLTPKKIVYKRDSGGGACAYNRAAHTVTCRYGTLAAGRSVSVDIEVDARGSVRWIKNIAEVTTSTTDPKEGNNRAVKEIYVKGGPKKEWPKTK